METLEVVLPVVINILIIALLTVCIILGIKCINIMDKAKAILLNVEEKVNSLNALFSVVTIINNKIALITDKVSLFIENMLTKLFHKINDEEEEEEIIVSVQEKKKKERKKKHE